MSAALLQLKLTLTGVMPPIWRRLLVTNQATLKRLHDSIQAVADWEDRHEHEFVIAEKRYGRPAPREVVPVENEALFRLHSLPLAKGAGFSYVYDFGEHWEVEVKVERVLPPDPGTPFALVIDGARAFPLEDSGGVAGYKELLQVLSDSSHPEYEECREWVGQGFDPERFDRAPSNERLRLLTQR
jgi:Plasmid pRiA4b ORF-3-like protein